MARLGVDTGLVLPAQVQAEIFGSCTSSRVHMGVKFATFMNNRGIGLDPDPVGAAEPRTWLDLACVITAYAALACAFARGCWLMADGHNVVVGVIWAVIPTLYALTTLKSRLSGDGAERGEALLQSST